MKEEQFNNSLTGGETEWKLYPSQSLWSSRNFKCERKFFFITASTNHYTNRITLGSKTRFRSSHGHYPIPRTFSVDGASSTLDPSMEAANCNLKLKKQVYFSCCLIFWSTTTSHRLKKNNFPCQNLNHRNLFSLFKSHLAVRIWTVSYAAYFLNP